MAEGTVLFDRGNGWFIIGPRFAHKQGDRVELPTKGVTVIAQDFDQKLPGDEWRMVAGLRRIEEGGSTFVTDGFRWAGTEQALRITS